MMPFRGPPPMGGPRFGAPRGPPMGPGMRPSLVSGLWQYLSLSEELSKFYDK